MLHRLLGLHCEPGCGGTVSGVVMSKRGVFVKDLSQTTAVAVKEVRAVWLKDTDISLESI